MIPDPSPADPFGRAFGLPEHPAPPPAAAGRPPVVVRGADPSEAHEGSEEELPDEAALDLISTVVALSGSVPVAPSAGTWEELRARLGWEEPTPVKAAGKFWPLAAGAGWGAAALLTVMLAWRGDSPPAATGSTLPEPGAGPAADSRLAISRDAAVPPAVSPPTSPPETTAEADRAAALAHLATKATGPRADREWLAHAAESLLQGEERVENHRLIQEIETLRHQLAQLRERDQERLVVTPGVSWPIVIEMHPPGVQMETADDSLTARLGDALTDQAPPASEIPEEAHAPAGGAITVAATETFATGTPDAATSPEVAATSFSASTTEAARKTPAATPIYDPARDLGTLALHNFDQLKSFALTTNATGTALREGTGAFGNAANANFSATAGNTVEAAANVEMASPVYSLWVLPSSTSEPVLVGQLPDDLPANATVDFTLGTTGIIPKAYYILGSAAQQPLVYDTRSILLQGP